MARKTRMSVRPLVAASRIVAALTTAALVVMVVIAVIPRSDARATGVACLYGPYTVKPAASRPGDFVFSPKIDLALPRIFSPVRVKLDALNLDGAEAFFVGVDGSFNGVYWDFDGSAEAHGEPPAAVGQQPPGFSAPALAAGQLVVPRFIRFGARWNGVPGPNASATYRVSFC
jgi:hypothetical protein